MGDLTRNFSRSEFRCPDCDFALPWPSLVQGLQEMRDQAGVPIKVLSGCRCKEWNKRVGGKQRSQHLQGKAADIVVVGMTPENMKELALDIKSFREGGIGVYPDNGFIHLDVRGRKARWNG